MRISRLGNLLIAQLLSVLGTQVTELAVPTLAVLRLGAGPGYTSALVTVAVLPAMLAGPWLGVHLDRVSPRTAMVTADLVRAAVIATIPAAAATGHLSLGLLLAVAGVIGLASLPFDTATSVLIPRLVPEARLSRANSLVTATDAVGRIGGPGLAGVLIGLLGAARAVLADVASYLFSALLLMFLPRVAPPPVTSRSSWIVQARQGLSVVRADPVLSRGMLGAALLNLGGSGIGGILTVYAYRDLRLTPVLLGLTMALGSFGVLAGALVAPRIGRRFGLTRACFVLSVAAALALFIIPAARLGAGFWLLVIYECAFGVSATAWAVLLITMRQQRAPREALGRVTSLQQTLSIAAFPLGTGVAALAATTLGLTPALLILCGIACGAPLLYSSPAFRKGTDRLEQTVHIG